MTSYIQACGVEGVTKGGHPHFLEKSSAVNSSAPGAPAPRQTGPATGHERGIYAFLQGLIDENRADLLRNMLQSLKPLL